MTQFPLLTGQSPDNYQPNVNALINAFNGFMNQVNNLLVGQAITALGISSASGLPTSIIVTGYATQGDYGAGAIYTSNGASPTGPLARQSADGVWFNLVLIPSSIPIGYAGAKSDGITDDSVAITTAIALTGSITLPSATTLFNSNLVWTTPININGAGSEFSILKFGGSSGTAIQYNQGQSADKTRWQGFTLLGPVDITTGGSSSIIGLYQGGSAGCARFDKTDVKIKGFGIGQQDGDRAYLIGHYACTWDLNYNHLYHPIPAGAVGERMTFVNCFFGYSGEVYSLGVESLANVGVYVASGDYYFHGCSFDCSRIEAIGGAITLTSNHYEWPSPSLTVNKLSAFLSVGATASVAMYGGYMINQATNNQANGCLIETVSGNAGGQLTIDGLTVSATASGLVDQGSALTVRMTNVTGLTNFTHYFVNSGGAQTTFDGVSQPRYNNGAINYTSNTLASMAFSQVETNSNIPRIQFEGVLYITGTAAGNIQIDFGGGSTTFSTFFADVEIWGGTTLLAKQQVTTTTTAVNGGSSTAPTMIRIQGTGVISSSGPHSWSIRGAQQAASGTTTINPGSYFTVRGVYN